MRRVFSISRAPMAPFEMDVQMSRDEAIEHRISVCAHDCPDTCSIKVGVRDGRIISITGDEDHPITRGFLCGKVNRYAERVYSPLRIKTPLRRIAAKGEGRFAPISWDEALDEIAYHLDMNRKNM